MSATALRDVTDAVLAQTTLGVWALDEHDRTTFVNDRMAAIVGADAAEMLGTAVYEFLDPAAAKATRAAFRRRRTGLSELREVTLTRGDGQIVHTFIEAIPFMDADGAYRGAVALVGDISARKRVEAEGGLLAALVQSSSDAIVAFSLDGAIQSWNPAAETLFGWSAISRS